MDEHILLFEAALRAFVDLVTMSLSVVLMVRLGELFTLSWFSLSTLGSASTSSFVPSVVMVPTVIFPIVEFVVLVSLLVDPDY